MTTTELQAAAAACGCIYRGTGMGLHHFIERESGGNFSMVVPFPALVAEKAADVRQRFGLQPLPVANATHAETQAGTGVSSLAQ